MQDLTPLGLTKAESIIYYSVLKQGTCTVKHIAKDCGFHRTNIYDILEQLKEKGLITFSKQGKTLVYTASDPQNFYNLLEEKKQFLDTLLPQLQELHKKPFEGIDIEVYKGEEGMKSAFRDMIREQKTIYGYGIKGQLREKLPVFAKQWLRDAQHKKIKYYGIYTEKKPPSYYTEIRYLPKEYGSPVAIFIYGDKININIWEPSLVAIVIHSPLITHMYRQHFNLLWGIAKT
ncbi:MAG TPA: helix-turn-helix domain-containing protein [Candidatus Nanoarchaeia archaeon]|nr:helix-turn-helix domain-containing protein [Candidatus Nanoarchaeia archaeon]